MYLKYKYVVHKRFLHKITKNLSPSLFVSALPHFLRKYILESKPFIILAV